MKWEPWGYHLKLLDDFLNHNEIVIGKARQIGLSWLLSIYALWVALFEESAKVLLFSQGEGEARDLIAKIAFLHDNLPSFLKVPRKHPDSRELIDFLTHGSEIVAKPSTGKAGRSTDATLVIRDELAYHENAEEHYLAVGPTIDSGGQLIDLSTRNPEEDNNHFTDRVTKAMEPDNNLKFIFLGWRERPVREEGLTLDEWWENKILTKYDDWQRAREYPATLDEFLSPPKELGRFDGDALNDIKQDIDSPLKNERNGIVKIYSHFIAGRRYVFVIDPAEGVGDPTVGKVIIDGIPPQVAASFEIRASKTEQALIIEDLWKRYNKPFLVIERNAFGMNLIDTLLEMNLTNWYYHDKARTKAGWWTGTNRATMINELADAIYARSLKDPDERCHSQFRSFIRTKRKSDGEARGKSHDDHVMCWAMFLQVRRSLPSGGGQTIVSKYSLKW